MDVERERRFNALLVAALEVPPDQRRRHLETRGEADAELIDEVLATLGSGEDDLGDFLERPAVLTGAPAGAEAEDPPPRIADFRILDRLGAGGMGEVFRAEQERPVRRVVALKRVHTHLPDEARIRFEAEQQALARLSHGSIARFYDSGTTADGRPWFSMELVDGSPITDYCDRAGLAVEARIELFLGVCAGVEHAHRRQILHRDLKPSNVLVIEDEGRPVPKVIDFGIAKLLDASPELRTLRTRAGILGTPAYTSPEALADPGDVDTRGDVYSLGVLLFELLAGHRPFESEDPGLGELLRRVREDEPETPGGLLYRLDPGEVQALAERRSTTVAALRRVLDSDLRWIVGRALEKERERRYGSVRELADDLRRFLADQPILARPPSGGYRLAKFVRRHRTAVAAGLVAALGLGAGAAGLAAGLVRAREEAASTRAALEESRELSEFLVGLFREADPTSTDGEELTVVELLDRGAEQIRARFADQPAVRGRLLQTLAAVQMERGHYDRAEPMLREAAELFERALPKGDPIRGSIQSSLGVLHSHRHEWASAEAAFRRALSEMGPEQEAGARALALHNLGVALYFQKRLDQAEERFRAALELRQQALPEDHPDLARSYNALGALLLGRERPQEALPFIEASVAHRERTLGPDHPDLAKSLVNLATVERKLRRFDRAVEHASRAASIEERALGPDHPDLGVSLKSVAENLTSAGRIDDALLAWDRVLQIRRRSRAGGTYLAEALSGRANLLAETGRLEEAEALYREAAGVYEETTEPGDPVRTYSRLGLAFIAWKRGDLDRAEEEARAVHEIRERAARPIGSANATLRILAGVARDRGDLRRAEELYRRALEVGPPHQATVSWSQRRLREEYAAMLRAAGRAADADAVAGPVPNGAG